MTEEEFVDILTRGKTLELPPGLDPEYIEYYRNNPWQIPNEFIRQYMKHYEREFETEHAKYIQQQTLIP